VTWLAAALAAVALWLAHAPAPEPRLRRLVGRAAPVRATASSTRLPRLAAVSAAVGAFALIGGVVGLAVAIACLVLVPKVAGRLESRGARRRREELERQAPEIAGLLAAALASGATLASALAAVADAVGDPAARVLRPVLAGLALGADPVQAWRGIADEPSLRPVGAALIRSTQSGAPLAGQLERIAEDMRRDRQQSVELAARAAGVRAVAPLGACFLPAFVLVGVVPVVVSLAAGLF